MKFLDLDGIERGVDMSKHARKAAPIKMSMGATKLWQKLCDVFQMCGIYVEFPCVGTRLKLDFYIPSMDMAFEFDGQQHDKYTPYFHGNKRGFGRSKGNDADKETWCELNRIKLIRVNDDNMDDLEDLIREAR